MSFGGLSSKMDTIANIKKIDGIIVPEELYLIFYTKDSLELIVDEIFSNNIWKDFFYNHKIKEDILLAHILVLSKEAKKNHAMTDRIIDNILYTISYNV